MSDVPGNDPVDVFPYLRALHERGGSDLFFSVGAPAHMKLEGQSQPLNDYVLRPGDVKRMAYQLMSARQAEEFERDLEQNLA